MESGKTILKTNNEKKKQIKKNVYKILRFLIQKMKLKTPKTIFFKINLNFQDLIKA